MEESEELMKRGSPKGMPKAEIPGERKEVREGGIGEDVSRGGRMRHLERFKCRPISEREVSKESRMASKEVGSAQMCVSSA